MSEGAEQEPPATEASEAEAGHESGGKRLLSLDVLRAAAVLLVLGRHLPEGLDPPRLEWITRFLEVWHRGGWVGVDLFFVLSGFLVSGLLFREEQRNGSISLKRFFIRRGFRIYPPFYTLLALTLLLLYWADPAQLTWQSVVGEVFYLQNYLGCLWAHTWTLAVEEHFYILLPFLVLLLLRLGRGRISPKGMIAAYLLVAGACLAQRVVLTQVPFHGSIHLVPTHVRIDSLLCGVLLSYLHHYRPLWLAPLVRDRLRMLFLAFLGVAFVAPTFVFVIDDTPFIYSYGFTLIQLGFGALLLCSLRLRVDGRTWRWLGFVGTHSYSVYLWHFPARGITIVCARLSPISLPSEVWVVVYLLLSLGLGIAMAKVVELPLLRLRDRLFPRREGALVGAD